MPNRTESTVLPNLRRAMEPHAVPFTMRFFTETWESFVTVHGVLRTEEDGVLLEFRRTETDFGTIVKHGEIRIVSVPWEEIVALDYRRRFPFRQALVLRTRSLRALDGVPDAQGTEVTLSIRRADRLAARAVAASVNLALAERRLLTLDTADAPPLPPIA